MPKRAPLPYPDCPAALAAARRAAGLTQTQVAERLGITQAHWSRLEAGRRAPWAEYAALAAQLRALAQAVGLDPAAFLALAEETGGRCAVKPAPPAGRIPPTDFRKLFPPGP